MAALSDADRAEVCAQWQRDNHIPVSIVKSELRAAINAIDAWVDSNAPSFNNAIPQPARGALTTKQKAWLLSYIVKKRFEVS